VVAAVVTLWSLSAFAQEIPAPYGRIGGDVTVAVGAGAVVASDGVRAAAEVRARYLDTAGVFVSYEDASLFGADTRPRRVLASGLELRPLFLYRWLRGQEIRDARLDLALDSFGLELGAALRPDDGSAALQVGLGLELPISGNAEGLWIALHGGARWSEEALALGAVRGPEDRELFVSVTLAWHQIFMTHLIDVGDRAPR
jgi:hypothetical protein